MPVLHPVTGVWEGGKGDCASDPLALAERFCEGSLPDRGVASPLRYSSGSEPIFITSCPALALDVNARNTGGMTVSKGPRTSRAEANLRAPARHLVLWVVIAIVLLGSLSAFVTPTSTALSGVHARVSGPALGETKGSTTPSEQVSEALKSLEEGNGPASGQTVQCGTGNGGESGTCQPMSSSTDDSGVTGEVPGSNPIASWGAEVVYDAADGYVLVYGGTAGDHTWTYLGGAWTELKLTSYPAIRTEASMTYDAADAEVILFGGEYHLPKGPGTNVSNVSYYSDTWAFHGGAWHNITNILDSPPGRYYAMMTYDAVDGYVVLFGGDYAKEFLGDTWTFKGGAWTNITDGTPRADTPNCRIDAGIAYDAAAGYIVMFGGTVKVGGVCQNGARNETSNETWSFSHGTWAELSPEASPPARWAESLVYDATTGSVVLFGGLGALDTSLADTWMFSRGNWTQIRPVLYPPGRFSAGMVFDPSTGNVLMFGGLSEPQRAAPILSDFWEFSSGDWVNLTLIPSPPPTSSMSFTYDGKDGYVLLFGGQNQSGGYVNDTWRFVGGVWLLLTPPTSPSARSGASMVYDGDAGYVLLFGGTDGSQRYNDTWAYFKGDWFEVNTSLGPSPPPRSGAGMAFDSATNQVILFGGNGSSGDLADTWSFQNTSFPNGTWTPLSPTVSPSPREGPAMTYYPPQKTVVLFGGDGSTGLLQDTWAYSAGNWTELSPQFLPSPRMDAAFTYDANDDYGLMFGGVGSSGPLNDTWSYLNGVWAILTPWSPAARSSAGMAFDSADSTVILFGGTGTTGTLADTWRYVGGNWSQLLPLPTKASHVTVPGKPSSKSFEYLVIGVGVAAIACLIIVLALRRGRKRSPTPLEPFSPPESAAEGSSAPAEPPPDRPPGGGGEPVPAANSGAVAPGSNE